MRIGTHCRCRRCCRCLLLPSFLRSPLPLPSPPLPQPPFLSPPLLFVFCHSHHCHRRRHHHHCLDCHFCRNQSRRSRPCVPLEPPICDLACLDPREKTRGILLLPPHEDRVRDDNPGGHRPRTLTPSSLPPRQLATISVPRSHRHQHGNDDDPMFFHRATECHDHQR